MVFEEIWERIKAETDLKSLSDLAMLVGTTQPFLSKKKRQNYFSTDWAYKVGQRYNLLTEWILTGRGPKRINEPIKLRKNRLDFLEDLEEWLSELIAKEPDRAEWAKHCISDALPAFKEWKRRKESNSIEEGEYPQGKVA